MNIDPISIRPASVPKEPTQRTVQPVERVESKISEVEIRKSDVEKVVQSINHFLEPSNSSLQFKLHEELGEYYVTIVDQQTNEVIREVPPKKILDIHAAMKEYMGLIIDKKL